MHLDNTTLALYVERRLSDPQLDELRSHIDTCESCRELLIELARGKLLAEGSEVGEAAPGMLGAGERIGRYVVEELVGAGAMGAVYVALDTELGRKVALKVMHRATASYAARMRREAQALARVADRGVVAVHDVGTHGDKVYIAMELVTGGTLAAWLREAPRSAAAIVANALGVARGLAAAHDVGLVHRDVKPDNILVDARGLPRIGDFGLAAAAGEHEEATGSAPAFATDLTASGMLLGTPAYMAPEQLDGDAATQRSDQFSFCVTLYEALFRVRPFAGKTLRELRAAMDLPLVLPDKPRVPSNVRMALARGLAIDPRERFTSMHVLARALDLAPHRRRRYVAIAAVAGLAALVTSVAIARSTAAVPARQCLDGERKLVGIWDPARKAELERAFLATGAPFAADAWRGFAQALDRYATRWTAMHRATCEATRVHGDQSEHVLELRMWCLDDRLHEATALVDGLRDATTASVARAVTAADRLASVDVCADAQALSQRLPPRSEAARANIDRTRATLAQVKALWDLGQLEQSRALLGAVRGGTLDYPPLEAEVLLLEARVQLALEGDAKAAEKTIERALWAADRGRDDHLRARAWNLLYFAVGAEQQRFADAAKIYEHASAALERLAGAELLQAQLLGNHGQVLTLAGSFDEAAATLERALALLEKTVGRDNSETGNSLAALADVYGRLGQQERSLAAAQRAYEVHVKSLGKRHPETAKSLFSIAVALENAGNYDDAAAKLTEVLATLEAALGKDHIDLANALDELGIVRRKQNRLEDALALHLRTLALREAKLGAQNETAVSLDNVGLVLGMLERHAEALPYHQRALAITEKAMGKDHIETATSRAYLANEYLGLGKPDEALAMFRAALAVSEKALGPDAADLAFFLAGIGTAQLDRKRPAEAVAPLERALALSRNEGNPMSVAEIEFTLARALWASKRDRPRALALARAALPPYQQTGDPTVERWLAAPR